MTYIAKPRLHHPTLEKNSVGYTRRDYEGKISTLCAGCGHDSISASIIQACWELDIEPHRVAKLSGIGCSSKTPDYFLGASHGFNTVHGRMPSVLTGANLANRELLYMGVSGDGDSASIGLGQFAHCMRRGVNMVYIVENNGVYGLTKVTALETAEDGITCNAICPGFVRTPLAEAQVKPLADKFGISEEAALRDHLLVKQPSRRWIEVEDIARMALYLCGPGSGAVNGAALSIDGGWLAA